MPKQAAKIAILLLLVSSCIAEEGEVTVPISVLRQSTLVPLLADIHMAEAKLSMHNIYGDSAAKLAVPLYNRVYQKYGVTQEELNHSIVFYTQHPLMFNNLYRSVIDTLQARQANIATTVAPRDTSASGKDSLRRTLNRQLENSAAERVYVPQEND